MSKFIELTIKNEGKVFINIDNIAYVRVDETRTRVYFNCLKKDDYLFGKTVEEDYDYVTSLLR